MAGRRGSRSRPFQVNRRRSNRRCSLKEFWGCPAVSAGILIAERSVCQKVYTINFMCWTRHTIKC